MGDTESPSGARRFPLGDEQRINWLMLIRSENVGPATFRDLINHFGTAGAALQALPELAKHGGTAAKIRVATQESAEKELEAAQRARARFIGMGEPDYPSILRGIANPPPLICIRGDVASGQKTSVGIVGSRNASITGMKLTGRIAGELGERGQTIVSGLARGIDTAAHKASLDTGTIAVFAGGIDRPFPEENIPLADDIATSGGALISEMPMGWKPRNIDFPRRNRLIAGLSLGVLVVEAARRSGSLITARMANETGRMVFAVPGSPLDPRAAGTNHLIKQGATLVTSADDIIDALSPVGGIEPQLPFDAGEEGEDYMPESATDLTENVRQRIVTALGPTPTDIDDIVRLTDASPGEVQLVLLELDLAGRLERHSSNRVSLLLD
ncbi:MAG: DNA-processing protein DprA [Pseudomonadota bacterium]